MLMLQAALALLFLGLLLGLVLAARKGVLGWLTSYFFWMFSRRSHPPHTHVMFCFADHYEPRWGGKRDMERERRRVARWVNDYPKLAREFTDADGNSPKHSFFFPAEEYEAEHIDALNQLCAQGLGEIEVHLHHDDDTSDNLRRTLLDFASTLHERHGALSRTADGDGPQYGFIHGNWVLDNSGVNGRWCGVNDEISVLRDTGCYADFTFPCAPHQAQPRQINSIYYATDDPTRPKSHNTGEPASVHDDNVGDLLLVTGPLCLNWRRRKHGIFPRIENADIRSSNPPTRERVDYWVKTGIHVKGRPEWVFVKVHTHGAPEREADTLLGDSVRTMHQYLTGHYNDGNRFSLHYVSAREAYNIVKAAEAGETGNPGDYRDYVLPPPANTLVAASKSVPSE